MGNVNPGLSLIKPRYTAAMLWQHGHVPVASALFGTKDGDFMKI
jgi:hypothetical protein